MYCERLKREMPTAECVRRADRVLSSKSAAKPATGSCDPVDCAVGKVARAELHQVAVAEVEEAFDQGDELDVLDDVDSAAFGAAACGLLPDPVDPEEIPEVEPIKTTHMPAAPAKEEPMIRMKCSKCGRPLRSDNAKGICGDAAACRLRQSFKESEHTIGRPAAGPVSPPIAAPARPPAALTSDRDLPAVQGLPVDYLVDCLAELRRRRLVINEALGSEA